MFGPVLWLGLSSFKTAAGLTEYPPTFLPLAQLEVVVEGYKKPLLLYNVKMEDGSVMKLAEIRRVGIISQMVDPNSPKTKYKIPHISITIPTGATENNEKACIGSTDVGRFRLEVSIRSLRRDS